MILITYIVLFRKDCGFDDIELDEDRGKNLGEIWLKDKKGSYEIDGSFYDGNQILAIIKNTKKML